MQGLLPILEWRRYQIAEKITVLPYAPPYCTKCGRDLPKGRKRKCHYCQPPKARHHHKSSDDLQEYTLADRVAQADAYGLSYGKFMSIIENGGKLPPMKHPVHWPPDSTHLGE